MSQVKPSASMVAARWRDVGPLPLSLSLSAAPKIVHALQSAAFVATKKRGNLGALGRESVQNLVLRCTDQRADSAPSTATEATAVASIPGDGNDKANSAS